MAMATATKTELYGSCFSVGAYVSDPSLPASITLSFDFSVVQTYHSSDRSLKSRTREPIGEICSRYPYHSITYRLISTTIGRMNLPFPLQKMQYFGSNTPEGKSIELENVDDLINQLLDEVRSTASRYSSESESAAGRKLLLCFSILIDRRVILQRHEIEAMDRAKEKEERVLKLREFVSDMAWKDSEDPYLDFSSAERRIGRRVRDTAPTEKALLDSKYERELESSLLERAMREYFQEPVETMKFEGNNNIDGDGDKGKEEQVVCGICKNEILIGKRVTRMPCSHIYHFRCIADCLKKSLTCPLCPFKLTTNY